MIRTKIKCEFCGQEISKSNYSKHIRRHKNHPETFEEPKYKLNHEGLICQFCGKECKNKNSLCNHERLCNQNPNKQIINSIEGFNNKGRVAWNKGLTKENNSSVKQQSETLKKKYESGEANPFFKGKIHSEETKNKISLSMQKYLEQNPNRVPYILNHSSKESYPETYFKELFLKENIQYIYHFRVNKYELDFAVPSLNLDIEIDGDQHYLDNKIIDSDVRRDKYLSDLGWKVFRIKWSSWKASNEYKQDTLNKLKLVMGK